MTALTRIDPIPFWGDFKKYRLNFLGRDLISALSIALMALPQAMAYAFVADLPTSAGVWSVIFGTIFTAAFGQSRFLVSGPTNVVAIMIQSGTAEILYTFYRGVSGPERDVIALSIVLQLVLMIGVFQILAGFLRLGRLTQFTSRSVVIGYIAGAALAILITQLFPFFGIHEMDGYHPLYQQGWYIIGNLQTLHVSTFLIGLGSFVVLLILFRMSKKIPGAAIVFLLAGGIVALFGLSSGEDPNRVMLLKEIGPVYTDLPIFKPPVLELRILTQLVPLAFAITLLTVLEATAIGRSYTKAKEPPYNDNQEIYGLGVSNFLSSFLGAMPSSGSFSRSALNYTLKAKTRFAAIFSGGIVFILVVSLGFIVGMIPIASISALLILTAFTMIDFKQLMICLRATRSDAVVVLATVISSLLFTLDVALYIGVALSIVLYLKQAAIPHLIEYAFNNVGKLRPLELEEERPDPSICILQAEGELFFGAADLLETKMRLISEDENIRVVILQLLNVRSIDASICLSLNRIFDYLKATKRHFLLSGVFPEILETLREAGLLEKIGEENCFIANEQLPSEPTREAYALAKKL